MPYDNDDAQRVIPVKREAEPPAPASVMAMAGVIFAILAGLGIAVHVTTP